MINDSHALELAAGAAVTIGKEVIALAIMRSHRGHILKYWLDSEPDDAFLEDQEDNISYWSDFDIDLRYRVLTGPPSLTEDDPNCVFVYSRSSAPVDRFPHWLTAWLPVDRSMMPLVLIANRACLGRVDPTVIDSVAIARNGAQTSLEVRVRKDSVTLRKAVVSAAGDLTEVLGAPVDPVVLDASILPRVPDSNSRVTVFLSGSPADPAATLTPGASST